MGWKLHYIWTPFVTFWFKISLTALSFASFDGSGPWSRTCPPSVSNISPGSLLRLTQSDFGAETSKTRRFTVLGSKFTFDWEHKWYSHTAANLFSSSFPFKGSLEDLLINRQFPSFPMMETQLVGCYWLELHRLIISSTWLDGHTSPGSTQIVLLCLFLRWRSGPNGDVVCQVFSEYARACAHADHPLHDWRQHIPHCGTFFPGVFAT